MLLPLQGATAPTRDTQGVATLALGYVLHWAFIDIIGCGSAIQASLIAFALHDDSARTCTYTSTIHKHLWYNHLGAAFSPYLHIHFYYTVISNETVHWF